MKRIVLFLGDLIFPPRCIGCGELMDLSCANDALCPSCRMKWEAAKNMPCPTCHNKSELCRCRPIYNKYRTVDGFRHLVIYGDEFIKRVIHSLKTERSNKTLSFLSGELATLILCRMDISGDDVILTYPSRSRESERKYGFDHARLLCKGISDRLAIPVYNGIINKGKTAQKELSYTERGENAVKSFSIPESGEAALAGKRVIFIDDIVTTGATAVSIAAKCKLLGAVSFSVFTLARTP